MTITSPWPQYCKGWLIMLRVHLKSSHRNCRLVSFLTSLRFRLPAKWHHWAECHTWCSMLHHKQRAIKYLLHCSRQAITAFCAACTLSARSGPQPVFWIAQGLISIFKRVMSLLVVYTFCCVFKMSKFICFIMKGSGQSRSSLIHCRWLNQL